MPRISPGRRKKVQTEKVYNQQTWDIPEGWCVYRQGSVDRERELSASKDYDKRKADTYIGQAMERIAPRSYGRVVKVLELEISCD